MRHLVAGSDLSRNLINTENFLYGFLSGFSFGSNTACNSGLTTTIYYAFESMKYREIYLPWNIMKFTTVQNKLTESTNKIYAYCDFSHLYDIMASLSPSMENLGNYGALASRVTGSLF